MDGGGEWPQRRMTLPLKSRPSSRTAVGLFPKTSYSGSDEGFHENRESFNSDRLNSNNSFVLFPKLYAEGERGSISVPDLGRTSVAPMDTSNTQLFKFLGKESGVSAFPGSKTRGKADPDSFFGSMRPLVYMFQVCALLPVSGASGMSYEQLRFRWLHWKLIYVAIVMTGIAFLFTCSILSAFKTELTYDKSAPLIFYGSGVVGLVLFVGLARNWEELNRQFALTEKVLGSYGNPPGQHFRFVAISIAFVTCALVEHILSLAASIINMYNCKEDSDGFFDVMRVYFINNYSQVFLFFHYHHILGIYIFISNLLSTCCWNLMDLFLGLIGLSLSTRLRQINDALMKVQGQERPSAYWRKVREEYNAVSTLVKIVDGYIQKIMLLSIGDNVFFVCLQLLQGLRGSVNTQQDIYFFWSFGFLMLRTCFVTLSAASIYDESREAKSVLFSVPHDSFCQEVRRFLTQITSDDIALTGCRFFSVTRGLILTIAGTVVTYEVVLVQFKGDSGSEESGGNKTNCMSLRRY